MIVYDAFGNPIPLGAQVARGERSTLYKVQGQPTVVAKLYNAYHVEYEAKLRWMIAHPPALALPPEQAPLAWPQQLLYNSRARFIGFRMPFIGRLVPLKRQFWRSQHRLEMYDLRYGYAWTLATTVEALHARGYVMGGALHPQNLFLSIPINIASLILPKAESFQVQVPQLVGRTLYPSTPPPDDNYLAPEQQGTNPATEYSMEQDTFALAVIIFELIGYRPFYGRWGYDRTTPDPLSWKRNLEMLHPALMALMKRYLFDGTSRPEARPQAGEWARALLTAGNALVTCIKGHAYPPTLPECPDCQKAPAQHAPISAPNIYVYQPGDPLVHCAKGHSYKAAFTECPICGRGARAPVSLRQPSPPPLRWWQQDWVGVMIILFLLLCILPLLIRITPG